MNLQLLAMIVDGSSWVHEESFSAAKAGWMAWRMEMDEMVLEAPIFKWY